MSSASDYEHSEPSQESSDESAIPPARPTSRTSRPQSRTSTPRKRRRQELVDPSQVRKYYLQGKYNDAYRVLYNKDVSCAAARFGTSAVGNQYYSTQIGASSWSAQEQATFFAALERLGRDDLPGIAGAIGTKSIPETQEFLLVLHDAATKRGDAKVTLRDIPAAIEVGPECDEQLELAGEALAWFQETFEANEEKEKFGDYWLMTSDIAGKIEDVLNPTQPRATTSPLAGEEGPRRRGGRVIVGACTSCKKSKLKCDRGIPCSNCIRRKTGECVYPETSIKSEQREHLRQSEPSGHVTSINNILEAIPEAKLLNPQMMLTLSKKLFMNRSPTVPSPWPHWSEYTSEFATEPAIYRTAFNDLHTLVISVTKRLMQTAIMQATSRLRSQRRRPKKGVIPLVKTRDVLSAIDVLGMPRNGKERWKGVARRCGLRVYDGKWSRYQNNRTRREVPWDEVEQIMTVIEPKPGAPTTDAETSDNDAPNFKSRAARSGTPLPIERLALSDSEEDEPTSDDSHGSLSDETEHLSRRAASRSRDAKGRYASIPTTAIDEEHVNQKLTLEHFDKEASRQEEHTLWQMLGIEPLTKDEEVKSNDDIEGEFELDENIITHPDGWRSLVAYHAEWEEFSAPVSPTEFATNEKPLAAPPLLPPKPFIQAESSSDNDTDSNTSRQRSQRRSKHNAQQAIELQARSARAYAALQSRASGLTRSEDDDSSDAEENVPYRSPGAASRPPEPSDRDSSDAHVDQPTQSIETGSQRLRSDDESTESETNQPAQSIESGSRRSPVVVSDDAPSDSSDVDMDRPARSIETGTKRPPAVHSDDEMGEMDWDTFID